MSKESAYTTIQNRRKQLVPLVRGEGRFVDSNPVCDLPSVLACLASLSFSCFVGSRCYSYSSFVLPPPPTENILLIPGVLASQSLLIEASKEPNRMSRAMEIGLLLLIRFFFSFSGWTYLPSTFPFGISISKKQKGGLGQGLLDRMGKQKN